MKAQDLIELINNSKELYCLGEDGYVGILDVNDIYDECAEPIDYNFPCEASEYKKVQITSYKPKN
jgi:hypothetical protein